eukprot:CAMPEP_0115112840 /NCGR_PEP_ID=MMETSP0227-20121206/40937_1 /TAXON_ID=89957 /ORGANISM="Polarella glacialis, Strain CCMP 1383" /LENGTH=384 /DNA_ID=CAMNT_0002512599 /DNA_START=43 /DNA_END=1193 /DNA_ORIENTATION=-
MTAGEDIARRNSGGDLQSPLLSSSRGRLGSRSVPVFSPTGVEVVLVETTQEEAGGCLSAVIRRSQSGLGDSTEVTFAIKSSVWINAFLTVVKMYAFIASGSMAVLASLVDSIIDLVGQGALMYTNALASTNNNADYPVGRGRLEPVGVMICAVVMGMASMEVISQSAWRLVKYWDRDDAPAAVLSFSTASMLVGVILLKGLLYKWSLGVSRRNPQNDSIKAIAQDNLNDVFSNIAAFIAPQTIDFGPSFWVVDPVAGILISVYIIYTWLVTGFEQVEMIVGKRADREFLAKVQNMAEEHHPSMKLDQLNAYHFGPRYLVEVEVVMPESTTLRESHDAGIILQHKIETLEEVERCFVHIDYQLRLHDDHDPEVPIDAKLYGGPMR